MFILTKINLHYYVIVYNGVKALDSTGFNNIIAIYYNDYDKPS